jgi:hypothetical protein
MELGDEMFQSSEPKASIDGKGSCHKRLRAKDMDWAHGGEEVVPAMVEDGWSEETGYSWSCIANHKCQGAKSIKTTLMRHGLYDA